jgi:hypothetical protein
MHFNAMFAREGGWVLRNKGQGQQLGDGGAVHGHFAKRGRPGMGRVNRKPLHRHAMRRA